ncbi:unnamed protein product [Coffea canephora]|uniref:Dirigent protein n=1 Tax=Coffea canephora TaxID=49390 RepID=A0A068VCD8_COFCA|nr:unnamed protein product [Coffea canephora]
MIMGGSTHFSVFLLVAIILLCSSSETVNATCYASEKQALMDFKKDLKDPHGRLSSWIHDVDCCKWEGVVCSNRSGHVIQLHLQSPVREIDDFGDEEESPLSGKISHSLQNLTHLRYLDLSLNDFSGIPIPSFFGSLRSLRYLDLSGAGFQGMVPYQLGNLSSLRTLSITCSVYSTDLQVDNLQWLAGLSNLEHLDMGGVDLSLASNWLEVINTIPSLVEIHLFSCQLDLISHYNGGRDTFVSLFHANFSSLTVLDLSRNFLGYVIPRWVFGLPALASLDLSWNSDNYLNGPIPSTVGNCTKLEYLSLRDNALSGSIPSNLGKLSSLEHWDISCNELNGTLPESLGQLSKLEELTIHDNLMEGIVSESHFDNLTALRYFDASENSLTLRVSVSWTPRVQFETLELSSWKLGPRFPTWIRSQKILRDLNLSFAGISDTIPPWLFNSSLQFVDFSHNQLHGGISHILCEVKNEYHDLQYLDLRENSLSGEIPDCWMNYPNLTHINLNSNNFTGSIPRSLFHLEDLDHLGLGNNSLTGPITFDFLQHAKEKLAELHFYVHDRVTAESPTSVLIAQVSPQEPHNKSPTMFGPTYVFDDPMTLGPEPSSKIISHAHGITSSASKEEDASQIGIMNLAFNDGKFNGSALSILGDYPFFQKYKEMAIVGGSGAFRLARGIVTAIIYTYNDTTQNEIIDFHVLVLHY